MFLKVLSHFIMKIKNFMKYFKKRVLEIFQNFHEIFKYFRVKYFIVHLYSPVWVKLKESVITASVMVVSSRTTQTMTRYSSRFDQRRRSDR